MFQFRFVSFLLLLMTFSAGAHADLLRAEFGIGAFSAEPGGTFEPTSGGPGVDLKNDLGIEKANDLYAWAYLKHPIPIIPNVRVEYLGLNHKPDQGEPFTVKELDGILYYNLLDNLLFVTLDLGIDIKYVEVDENDIESDTTKTLALLYGRARVEPVDWLGVEALLTTTNYGDNKGYDARFKIDYTMTFVPVVQPGVELGYRLHKIQYQIGNTINKAEYTGIYGGLMLRF